MSREDAALTAAVTGWAAAVRRQAYGDLLLSLTLVGGVLGPMVGLTGALVFLSSGPSRADALVYLPHLAVFSLALSLAGAVLAHYLRVSLGNHPFALSLVLLETTLERVDAAGKGKS